MVGSPYCISIENIKDREEYKELLANIIDLANLEVSSSKNGGTACWDIVQLERVVIPEMSELFRYLLSGVLFLKYGKQQRLLESAYLMTDSLNMLGDTPLGIQIRNLQKKIIAQKDSE